MTMKFSKKNKEDDFMPTAIIMTPTKKTLKNTRTSLDEIRKKAQERRKYYNRESYDAKEQNEFFKIVESSIYKEIVSGDDEV